MIRYRGANPIQHALLNGDAETGVSIIDLHPDRFDAGRILMQKVMEIPEDVVYTTLAARLAQCGAEMMMSVLGDVEGRLAHAREQDEALVTPAPKIPPEKSRVDFAQQNVAEIVRLYRATERVYCYFRDKRVKLIGVREVYCCAAIGVTYSSIVSGRKETARLHSQIHSQAGLLCLERTVCWW